MIKFDLQMSHRENDEVMTFNIEKVKGWMHCDILVFSKKCSGHYSVPQLWNSNLIGALRHAVAMQ